MLTPPEGLDEGTLASTLDQHWGVRGSLEYRPVGWGSHHFSVEDRWFVSVDELPAKRLSRDEPLELPFARLTASLTAASDLVADGLGFVVAPVPSHDGPPAVRLGQRLAVAVYPYIVGQSFDWARWSSPEHRRATLAMVVAVHTATPSGPAGVAPIPHRDALVAAIDGNSVDSGPYAALVADLIQTHATPIASSLHHYDSLVAELDPAGGVLTHGEPHPGNTMLTKAGWRLIDWDTAEVGPPERDLWALAENDPAVLKEYAEATGTRPRVDVLELYRVRWDLADIAADVARLRSPHWGNADDDKAWANVRALVVGLHG
ncbi:hypothetical protein acdb102_32510 [Acidothermaceae bacterium B102]|nr:hypothetical protein acdb102_32510 [Acidothermaceae bacterium B102]